MMKFFRKYLGLEAPKGEPASRREIAPPPQVITRAEQEAEERQRKALIVKENESVALRHGDVNHALASAKGLFAPGYEGRRLEKIKKVVETQVGITKAGTELLNAVNVYAATHANQHGIRETVAAGIQTTASAARAHAADARVNERMAEEHERAFHEAAELRSLERQVEREERLAQLEARRAAIGKTSPPAAPSKVESGLEAKIRKAQGKPQ